MIHVIIYKRKLLIRRGFFLVLYLFGVLVIATAQINSWTSTDSSKFKPAIQDLIIGERKAIRATSELFIAQAIPWSINRFVRKADFAKISFKSLSHNVNPSSWEWDDNSFQTNQFAHPFHGSLYFNAFRSNGYSFWQSAPVAFSGSLFWEIAGETHVPAPNDFINTSLGGISLGEMTHRLANSLIDPSARGFKRTTQEVLGLIINPMNGLNRILNRKWGRVEPFRTRDSSTKLVNAFVDYGGRFFSERSSDFLRRRGNNEFYMRLRLLYGNPDEASVIPFSAFNMSAEVGASDSGYLNTLMVTGYIRRWKMSARSMGLISMNYDFFKNNAFEYGAQSFRFTVMSDWKQKNPKNKVRTTVGGSIIALAAVPDVYLYYGEGRNYDYGPGIGYHAGTEISFHDVLFFNFQYRGGWFKTLNGNQSNFFLNTVTNEVRYEPRKNLFFTLELGHFSLQGNYARYPDFTRTYPFLRYSTGFRF